MPVHTVMMNILNLCICTSWISVTGLLKIMRKSKECMKNMRRNNGYGG